MNSENLDQTNTKRSFWNTTVGIITKITAILTAVTALIIAIRNFTSTVQLKNETSSSSGISSDQNTSNNVTGTDDSPKEPVIITPPIEKKPNISISAFSVSPSEIELDQDAKPKLFTATLEAFNNGDALAANCMCTLISDRGIIGNASSESFSLDPDNKKSITIKATISKSANITAKLSCSNDEEKLSSPFYITVYDYGTIHHIIPKTQP